ncbi:MAG: excinuclease ABC subunit UvrB, partial [Lentisphaeria bacterium]|nr:excinuclease ABC subunit UvrB [Lentisphaeria bacterium]
TYIAKDAAINETIEKLRLSATASLVDRRDVIVVSSVSCIYGLGSPDDYANMCVTLEVGDTLDRDEILRRLVAIQYERNDTAPEKGQFRVRGDVLDVYEPQRDDFIRVSFWDGEIESLERRSIVNGELKTRPPKVTLYPCRHFVLPESRIEEASGAIMAEMRECVKKFNETGKLVEAQRLYERVSYDMEMMREIGYCSGIENYSMHLAQRPPGSRPYCLFDFFPDDFLTIVDESHVTIPQLGAMYKADRNRKTTLVEHGFRLPSALENRPLQFAEFEMLKGDTIYVSATPGDYEAKRTPALPMIEQIVRPTGLLDPEIEVRPLETQIDDVLAEIRLCTARGERVLVTTMTKKSAERLSDYLTELGVRCAYLHSEMDALARIRVLSKLRDGDVDCLVGINLLREGIDLPEVALVAILDADKEGFLRSERSLVQVAGRAARNAKGRVILYADTITDSMKALMDGTEARRKKQAEYNKKHHITPKTIIRQSAPTVNDVIARDQPKKSALPSGKMAGEVFDSKGAVDFDKLGLSPDESAMLVAELEKEMLAAAAELEFERAADLRDRIRKIQKK